MFMIYHFSDTEKQYYKLPLSNGENSHPLYLIIS